MYEIHKGNNDVITDQIPTVSAAIEENNHNTNNTKGEEGAKCSNCLVYSTACCLCVSPYLECIFSVLCICCILGCKAMCDD